MKFKNGVNFIFGEKDVNDPKESLNSIGKTTFLDLIDFCLLASPLKSHNPRLYAAKELISGYDICLEFSIQERLYVIKRNIESANYPKFGELGKEQEVRIENLKKVLGNLLFKREDYEGIFHPDWFRILIGFYLKIQKFKKSKFTDPIHYIDEMSEADINYIHFFLLGITNKLSVKISEIRQELKKINPAIKEVQRFVEQKYELKNLSDTNSQIDKLRIDVRKLEKAIEKFELGEQYEDAENEANKLTSLIKTLLLDNFQDKKKLEAYKNSIELKDTVIPSRISNIYKELNETIAEKVNKTLKEAVDFRKSLSNSRLSFLQKIIERTEDIIKQRQQMIDENEKKRADIFYFLSAKEAITDLTEAFFAISEKRTQLAELESNSKILNDLLSEKSDYEMTLKGIETASYNFIEDNKDKRLDFYETMLKVYNAIYVENKDELKFSFDVNSKKQKLIDINISFPDMFGKGKNQGRTLVYDIAVLIHNLKQENFPKFLIHDGIFDGMDKSQFIGACEFIMEMSKTNKIQYITTVNEEGTLSEKFGHSDLINPNSIKADAILVLNPNKKLLGQDF
ncbi:MAG: DUF2326 domain-containing protein [Saprospiraceae bacterium]|nr:DUF2326 domain-containing protein [Saprospiraceae bacterium]